MRGSPLLGALAPDTFGNAIRFGGNRRGRGPSRGAGTDSAACSAPSFSLANSRLAALRGVGEGRMLSDNELLCWWAGAGLIVEALVVAHGTATGRVAGATPG